MASKVSIPQIVDLSVSVAKEGRSAYYRSRGKAERRSRCFVEWTRFAKKCQSVGGVSLSVCDCAIKPTPTPTMLHPPNLLKVNAKGHACETEVRGVLSYGYSGILDHSKRSAIH